MECSESREIIRQMHDRAATISLASSSILAADEHLIGCKDCKLWFHREMCAIAEAFLQDEQVNEDMLATHSMMHEFLDTDCAATIA